MLLRVCRFSDTKMVAGNKFALFMHLFMDTTLTPRELILADYIRATRLAPVILVAALLTIVAALLLPPPVAAILAVAIVGGAGLQTFALIRASIRTLTLDDDVEYVED